MPRPRPIKKPTQFMPAWGWWLVGAQVVLIVIVFLAISGKFKKMYDASTGAAESISDSLHACGINKKSEPDLQIPSKPEAPRAFDHPAEYRKMSSAMLVTAQILANCNAKSYRLKMDRAYPDKSYSEVENSIKSSEQSDMLSVARKQIKEFSATLRDYPPPPPEWADARKLLIEVQLSLEVMGKTISQDKDEHGNKFVYVEEKETMDYAASPFIDGYKKIDLMLPY